MAHVIEVQYEACQHGATCGCPSKLSNKTAPILGLPQVCWSTGEPWSEPNLWSFHLIQRGCKVATVTSLMRGMATYATWLERQKLDWWDFPDLEHERCLTLFHGALKKLRNSGQFAPSTTYQRMRSVIRFYKWVYKNALISPSTLESVSTLGVNVVDSFGFRDTMKPDVLADVSFKHRNLVGGSNLEDGVFPVSLGVQQEILKWVKTHGTIELYLMLSLGFWSGLRIGSIVDLKINTIINSVFDDKYGIFRASIGPSATPPVSTKNNKNGHRKVIILPRLRDELIAYSTSARRMKRQSKASPECKGHLFLTKYGNKYGGKKSGIDVEMYRLRARAEISGLGAFDGFYFHRSRATFATELTRIALNYLPLADAIAFVKDACMHEKEETTLNYIHFIRTTDGVVDVYNEYAKSFMGCAIQK